MYPDTCDELAIQERLTYGAVPVPERGSDAVFVALLWNERVPDAVPLFFGVNVTFRDTSFPTGTVSGRSTPGTANCELLLDNEEMVTLAPVAFNPNVSESVIPTATLPKLSVVGAKVNSGWVDAVPVPVSGTVNDGPETKALPLASPAACGVKVAVNFKVFPAARVKGKLAPLTENALPVVCRLERVTAEVPALVSTTGNVDPAPTATFPNARLGGVAVTVSPATPEPPISRSKVGLEALAKLTSPSAEPVDLGAKITLTSKLAPAARTSGSFNFDVVNSLLTTVTVEIVKLAGPLLVTVTRSVLVWPTVTLP